MDNPMCPCEEEEQTANHLVFHCKMFRKQRNEMINKTHLWKLTYDE